MNTKTSIGASEDNALADKVSDDNSNPQQGSGISSSRTKGTGMSSTSFTGGAERPTTKVPPNKKDSRKLFVGGLPINVTEEEFRDFFQQFGPIIDSVVMIDRETRRSRGFGFVTFEDPAVARSLLNTTDQNGKQVGKVTMRGKVCEVKAAQPKDHSYGNGLRRGSRNDRPQRSHSKKFVRVPTPMADNVFAPVPNEMPAAIYPMDHAAMAHGVAPPNFTGLPPWQYGAPGVVVEEPGFGPGTYPPGLVPSQGYYQTPHAPAQVPAAPQGSAYGGPIQYFPYAAYPPEMVPHEGTMPVMPVVGSSTGANMQQQLSVPHMVGPYEVNIPSNYNGAVINYDDVADEKKTEALSSEGEKTGQA